MIKVKVRKIGGSFGLFIPKENAKRLDLRENEEVMVDITRQNPLRELFGSGKFSKPTEELLKESRKNLSRHW